MIVSCSSCTTKFNVPDSKVAGKRARMKCKKCGTEIVIDGTQLGREGSSPQASAEPSRPSSSRPHHSSPLNEPATREPLDISPRWRIAEPSGRRVEASLDETARLYTSGFAMGTVICAPGKTAWLPPDQFPELVRRAGQKVITSRPPLPTFTDETVAFGAAETEVLKFQSRNPPGVRSLAPQAPSSRGFFDAGDVVDAMTSFDNLTSARPPGSISPPPPPHLPPPPMFPTGVALPSVAPPAPRPAAPYPPHPAPAFPSTAPSASSPFNTRVPASSPHSAPPPPSSHPVQSPQATHPLQTAVPRSSPFGAPAPSPYSVPPLPGSSPAAAPSAPRYAPPLQESVWDGDSAPVSGHELDFGYQKPRRSRWIFVLIVALLVGGGAAIYRVKPEWVALARTQVTHWVTRLVPRPRTPALPQGPDFDTATAGLVLGQAAQDSAQCKQPDGPLGKGRARVLFEPSGKAMEVAVSEPFNGTPVGRCVINLFLQAKVPAFGGQPVIVNKTFEVK